MQEFEESYRYICHKCEDGVERRMDFFANHLVAKHGYQLEEAVKFIARYIMEGLASPLKRTHAGEV